MMMRQATHIALMIAALLSLTVRAGDVPDRSMVLAGVDEDSMRVRLDESLATA